MGKLAGWALRHCGDGDAWNSFDAFDQSVPIGRPYQLARYPVTVAQFDCLCGRPMSMTNAGGPVCPKTRNTGHGLATLVDGGESAEREGHLVPGGRVCRWLIISLSLQAGLSRRLRLCCRTSTEKWRRRCAGDGQTDERVYPWGAAVSAEYANYDDTGLGQTSAVGIFPQVFQPQELSL